MAWQSLGFVRGKKRFNLRMWTRTGYERPEYVCTQDAWSCTIHPVIGGHFSKKSAIASWMEDHPDAGEFDPRYD